MLGERLIALWAPVVAAALLASLAAIPREPASGPGPAERPSARDAAEASVVANAVTLTVDPEGTVHVREEATVRGGPATREITTRVRADERRDRLFRVRDLHVTGDGEAEVSVTDEATSIELPGSGRRTYTVEYAVVGAVTSVAGSAQVRWAAVGAWDVPVSSASVTVEGPAPLDHLSCRTGAAEAARPCTSAVLTHTRQEGRFAETALRRGETLTVVAGFPADAVAADPVLSPRRTLATAFTLSRFTGGALLLLLVALLGGVGLLYWTRGRDARSLSRDAEAGRRAPLRRAADGHVRFAPPDGVRPGQVGTLVDEQADVVDITATIVDLAVRNYLLVEELPHERFESADWRLVRRNPPDEQLLPYERALYEGLFADRDSVRLSELGDGFAASLAVVRDRMYEDVVGQGWFARRPDTVRGRWTALGVALTVAGVATTVVLALVTQVGLLGLAVVIAGAALAVGGQFMPAKTAEGSTVLAHMAGLRDYMRGAGEVDVPDDQRIEIFSRYLPYALVFASVDRWAGIVSSVRPEHPDDRPDNLYWYAGPAEWDLSNFGDSMRMLALTASGAISSSRAFRSL